MNQDMYAEWLVKRKAPVIYYASIPALALLAIFGFLLSLWSPILGTAALVLSIIGFYFAFRLIRVEYEYIFVTNELQVDKIMNQQKRKRVLTVQMSDVERIVPLHGEEWKNSLSDRKKTDASGHRKDGRLFGIYYNTSDGNHLLIFEPNDKLLHVLKRSVGRKLEWDV